MKFVILQYGALSVCFYVCSHWQMKLEFPESFQRDGPKCPKVYGNFRVFCAQKWTGCWAVLIPCSCTKGNCSWITVFANRATFGGKFSGTALWGSCSHQAGVCAELSCGSCHLWTGSRSSSARQKRVFKKPWAVSDFWTLHADLVALTVRDYYT